MKLMTRQIRTSLKNCHSDMQLTLEDDINVPDSKPDIEHIIKIQGEIHVQETSAETDRAIIRGQLSFSLLYLSDVDFRQIHTMQGQIPFEESINLENANPDQEVHCHYDLEDCRASLINSRKISVRAILSLHCCQEEEHILAIGTGIVSDDAVQAEMGDPTPPAGVEQQLAPMSVTTMTSHQKDLFRIKDETSLPKGKPSCENVLYYELSTQGLATRLVDDGIRITGDLLISGLIFLPSCVSAICNILKLNCHLTASSLVVAATKIWLLILKLFPAKNHWNAAAMKTAKCASLM